MTEIVVDGETGLLVEPDNRHALAEAIRWLLTHPDDGKRMGARGRDRVYKHFSVERMGDATFELYRTCA